MKVASDEGLPFPRLEHHIYDITPERAIMLVSTSALWMTDSAVQRGSYCQRPSVTKFWR